MGVSPVLLKYIFSKMCCHDHISLSNIRKSCNIDIFEEAKMICILGSYWKDALSLGFTDNNSVTA